MTGDSTFRQHSRKHFGKKLENILIQTKEKGILRVPVECIFVINKINYNCHLKQSRPQNWRFRGTDLLRIVMQNVPLSVKITNCYFKLSDQMARLFFQHLAIYNIENWPNSKKNCHIMFIFCQTLNKPLQNQPTLLKYCQSGEILANLATLILTSSH